MIEKFYLVTIASYQFSFLSYFQSLSFPKKTSQALYSLPPTPPFSPQITIYRPNVLFSTTLNPA